ncbi:MAG: RNA methyltransferase [Pseudomonadota bacterium]
MAGLVRLWCLPILLAALLVSCISQQSREATRLLEDIDRGSGPSALKAATPTPTRSELSYEIDGRLRLADLYQPNQPVGAALVLVPGFTPHGKNDRRVVELANSLARVRFQVLVPDLAGARNLRVSLADADAIADGVVHLSGLAARGQGVGILAISYGVGLAVLASEQPEVAGRLAFLVGIGAYYDTASLITFMTTGTYREPASGTLHRIEPEPDAKWIFLASNVDVLSDADDQLKLRAIAERHLLSPGASVTPLAKVLGPEGRALYDLMTNQDPARVAALSDALPAEVRARIQELSLAGRDLSPLAGKLILVHGREDTLIPYTESQALAAAVPDSELFLIDGFSHIEPSDVGVLGQLQLIDAAVAVLNRRQ